MSNITLNIVEPVGPTPVDPGIDPVVPNTGLFTHGIGGPEATIIGAVIILTIAAIVVAFLYRKQKKSGKVTKLVHLVDSCKAIAKSKKRITAGLSVLALLASAGTFATLLANSNKSNTSAIEGEDGLTLDISSEDFTIEVGDAPVFAVLPVELTVEEATRAGYTLTAFTDSTDLVSTTDESNTISMVTAEGDELVALANNTYGLALAEPASQAEEVYTTLSTDAEIPTFITDKDHKATEAGDTTTIYYGFYITPDVPYGTYTGSDVYYDAEKNDATILTFDGNDSDGGIAMEGMTIIAGDTITLPENTYTRAGYSFTGWNTAADGTGKAYADEAEFTASLTESEDITFYAQWEALPVISDLTEMQDFAKLSTAGKASVLASMTPGQQYQLKDNRDQTMYYIAKLADGNVWMTQNLDLNLSTEVTLTPANTNITKDWKPDNSTIAIQDGSFPGWENNNNVPYSADPGDVYYYTTGDDTDEQAIDKETCERDHEDGSCPHYHAGNYYNWSATVAMNDTSEYGDDDQYVNAETSICPAGWRLPKNANAESYTDGNEQITMITSYDGILGEWQSGPPGGFYSYLDSGFNAIRTNPLWLARSGDVYNGSLYSTGDNGSYWSSTVVDSDRTYQLNFYSGDVYPADRYSRYRGCSVRCIAQ